MLQAPNPNEASEFRPVAGCFINESFLNMLQAPKMTTKLAFSVEANGLMVCKAEYLTDETVNDERLVAVKEWELWLPRNSAFYQLLTGETS